MHLRVATAVWAFVLSGKINPLTLLPFYTLKVKFKDRTGNEARGNEVEVRNGESDGKVELESWGKEKNCRASESKF